MSDAPRTTLFCSPKAFTGHNALIQRNAIANWRALNLPVILMGNDPGVAEAAVEFGCRHIPDVDCTEYGTPRLDSMFLKAQQAAETPFIGYINGDILLPPSFVSSVETVAAYRKDFLMVGRRWDVDVVEALDYSPGWPQRLEAIRLKSGVLHGPWGIDYFVFARGSITDMPPFVVGRPGWDGWVIDSAARRGMALVNATAAVSVLHQNHDYRHVPGAIGNQTTGSPESNQNMALIKALNPRHLSEHCSVYRASLRLGRDGRIGPDVTRPRLVFYAKVLRVLLLISSRRFLSKALSPRLYGMLENFYRRLKSR